MFCGIFEDKNIESSANDGGLPSEVSEGNENFTGLFV